MPRSKKKPSAASQIVITPSTSIISRLDEVRGWTGAVCLMCNERPQCLESYIGQCRQCLEAGKKALQEQRANKAFRGTPVTAALGPREGKD